MSDNTVIQQPVTSGDIISTEDIGGGIKLPRSKIVIGTHDSDGGDVWAGNPLPIFGTTTSIPGGVQTVAPSGTFTVAYGQGIFAILGTVAGSGTFLTQDASAGPVIPGAVASKSMLGAMQYNTSNPSPTNTQQLALQSDSIGNLKVLSTPSGVQTISGTISGSGTFTTQDNSDGPVGPGVAAAKSSLAGMVYNTALPGPSQSQQLALQSDSTGNLRVVNTPSGVQVVSGTITNVPSGVQSTQDASDGPVTSGAAASKSMLGGMIYTTIVPSPSSGQQLALQSDNQGNLKVISLSTSNVSIVGTVTLGNNSVGVTYGGGTPFPTQDLAEGPVTPGVAAPVSLLAGMVYKSATQTASTGQQLALQSDVNGNLKVVTAASGTQTVQGTVSVVPTGTANVFITNSSANILSSVPTGTESAIVTRNIRNDIAVTSGTITAVDVVTTTVTNSIGQTITSGTPTAGSSVSCVLSAHTVVMVELSGTYNGTVALERSVDSGTNYVPFSMEEVAIGLTASSLAISDNKVYVLSGNAGGLTNFRARCTAITSGTLTVKVQPGFGTRQVIANQGPPNTVANAWPVELIPATTGGLAIYSFLSTSAVQAASIKNSAGQVYAIEFFNNSTSIAYVRLYNQTTTPGTGDTVVWRGMIPANANGAGLVKSWDNGLKFSTGIGLRVTLGIADNDNTVLTSNNIMGNVIYI